MLSKLPHLRAIKRSCDCFCAAAQIRAFKAVDMAQLSKLLVTKAMKVLLDCCSIWVLILTPEQILLEMLW